MSPVRAGDCRSETLEWFAPDASAYRSRLDAWCAGVGLPVVESFHTGDAGESASIADITFVSWNVHVGNGDVRRFVRELREGRLTDGRTVRHFVLLLQEAVRSNGVPAYLAGAAGAARIGAADQSQDIVEVSRELGLELIYVPSMRNGNSPADPATDRGSAILSTLRLDQPRAVELPGERQRRVAIIASIATASALEERLSVGVIHLDALGSSRRLWVFATPAMRESQVKAMVPLLPEGPLVLGADLNTWHGADESAARYLSKLFTSTPVSFKRRGFGFRVLDYLFFRPGDRRRAQYREAPARYGSDHRPLIGWVE
jgi:endonuclease/exonuclease/phosphatase family metal-dependent hydrolase